MRPDLLNIEWQLSLQNLIIEAKLLEIKLKVMEICEKAGYNPDQPRIPSGEPDGGQWTDGSSTFHNPKEPSLPNLRIPAEEHFNQDNLITALSIIPAGEIFFSINAAEKTWRGANLLLDKRTLSIMKNLEEYFGGIPKTIFNKKGDLVMVRGKKKVRFDIKKPGKYKPHFQIEEEDLYGDWIDVGEHHYYFKD